MTAFNDTFFFAHAMEIRILIAIGAIVLGFALVQIATLIGGLVQTLRLALGNAEGRTAAPQLSAAGSR